MLNRFFLSFYKKLKILCKIFIKVFILLKTRSLVSSEESRYLVVGLIWGWFKCLKCKSGHGNYQALSYLSSPCFLAPVYEVRQEWTSFYILGRSRDSAGCSAQLAKCFCFLHWVLGTPSSEMEWGSPGLLGSYNARQAARRALPCPGLLIWKTGGECVLLPRGELGYGTARCQDHVLLTYPMPQEKAGDPNCFRKGCVFIYCQVGEKPYPKDP